MQVREVLVASRALEGTLTCMVCTELMSNAVVLEVIVRSASSYLCTSLFQVLACECVATAEGGNSACIMSDFMMTLLAAALRAQHLRKLLERQKAGQSQDLPRARVQKEPAGQGGRGQQNHRATLRQPQLPAAGASSHHGTPHPAPYNTRAPGSPHLASETGAQT